MCGIVLSSLCYEEGKKEKRKKKKLAYFCDLSGQIRKGRKRGRKPTYPHL